MSKTVLITGAAGNLGGFLARHLLGSDLDLRLMIHRTHLPYDTQGHANVQLVRADLARPETLLPACAGVDCIVHFAGVLFRPGPEQFLPTTNTQWTRNLLGAAEQAGVGRFILISFPHVEGPTGLSHLATDRQDADPISAHARTRLAAEKAVFDTGARTGMEAVALRVGMVYSRGVLMVDYARHLLEMGLLGIWPHPTVIHLISTRDFLAAIEVAVRKEHVRGIYNIGDDQPITLQAFLGRCATHWGLRQPWRAPRFSFFLAAWCVELYSRVFGTQAPITRDFIRIGMVPYAMDTSRMRAELLAELTYPTLADGMVEM